MIHRRIVRRAVACAVGSALACTSVGVAAPAQAAAAPVVEASSPEAHPEIISAQVTSATALDTVVARLSHGAYSGTFPLHREGGVWRTDAVTGLPHGFYHVEVIATDTAGNVGSDDFGSHHYQVTPHVISASLPGGPLTAENPRVRATGEIQLWDPATASYAADAFGRVILELVAGSNAVSKKADVRSDGSFAVSAVPGWDVGGTTLTARLSWDWYDFTLFTDLPDPAFGSNGIARAEIGVAEPVADPAATRLTIGRPAVNRNGVLALKGRLTVVSGGASALAAGRTVAVQQSRTGTTGWRTVATATTSASGAFAVRSTSARPAFFVRAVFSGSEVLAQSTSVVKRMTRRATRIAAWRVSPKVADGGRLLLTGTLQQRTATGRFVRIGRRATVSLCFTPQGSTRTRCVARATTSVSGAFRARPVERGDGYWTARWVSNTRSLLSATSPRRHVAVR